MDTGYQTVANHEITVGERVRLRQGRDVVYAYVQEVLGHTAPVFPNGPESREERFFLSGYRVANENGTVTEVQVRDVEPVPTPGMPATESSGSDSYATSIKSVNASGKTITLDDDRTATLREDGFYRIAGNGVKSRCGLVVIGFATNRRDPHR